MLIVLAWGTIFAVSDSTQLIGSLLLFLGALVAAVFGFVQAGQARKSANKANERKDDQSEFVIFRDSYVLRMSEWDKELSQCKEDLADERIARQTVERDLEAERLENRQKRLEDAEKDKKILELETRVHALEQELKKVKGE